MDPFTAFLLQAAANRAGRLVLELGAPGGGNLVSPCAPALPGESRRPGDYDPEPDYDLHTTKMPWEC